MSGGSYDYFFLKLEDFARDVRRDAERRTLSEEVKVKRLAFAELIEKVAKAAHALEYVNGGDYASGQEISALDAVLPTILPTSKQLFDEAHALMSTALGESVSTEELQCRRNLAHCLKQQAMCPSAISYWRAQLQKIQNSEASHD